MELENNGPLYCTSPNTGQPTVCIATLMVLESNDYGA
jgi:hypothetical protein